MVKHGIKSFSHCSIAQYFLVKLFTTNGGEKGLMKQYKSDLPCGATQLRNPVANKKTGRHHCKECEGFTVRDLEGYARTIGVATDRYDTKQDLCNKIFDRVGLRGQNVFDKLVSGVLGIPPAEAAFQAPPYQAPLPYQAPVLGRPQTAFPFAPAAPAAPFAPAPGPIVRSKLVFRPMIGVVERPEGVRYPADVEQLLVEDKTEYPMFDQTVSELSTKLRNLLAALAKRNVVFKLDDPAGRRPVFPPDLILQTVKPAADKGKRQSFLMFVPDGRYLGTLQFKVGEREVQEEVKPIAIEELSDEMKLRLALGEALEEGTTKKRGLGK